MKDFVKRMIEEHKALCIKINKLDNWVYSEKSNQDDKIEFANKCMQLKGMKLYESALYARLENQGITFINGSYVTEIDNINNKISENNESENIQQE